MEAEDALATRVWQRSDVPCSIDLVAATQFYRTVWLTGIGRRWAAGRLRSNASAGVPESQFEADGFDRRWLTKTEHEQDQRLQSSPNKSLQRSVNRKVLGRGRVVSAPSLALRARVLTSQPAAAELGR